MKPSKTTLESFEERVVRWKEYYLLVSLDPTLNSILLLIW